MISSNITSTNYWVRWNLGSHSTPNIQWKTFRVWTWHVLIFQIQNLRSFGRGPWISSGYNNLWCWNSNWNLKNHKYIKKKKCKGTYTIHFRGRPYMTSDGRGEGVSVKSDFICKAVLIKHLMRGEGVQKGQKSSDVIYGRPQTHFRFGFFSF